VRFKSQLCIGVSITILIKHVEDRTIKLLVISRIVVKSFHKFVDHNIYDVYLLHNVLNFASFTAFNLDQFKRELICN